MGFGQSNPYGYSTGPDIGGLFVLFLIITGIGLLRYFTKDLDGKIPKETIKLSDWPLKFLWKFKLRIGASILTFFSAGLGVAIFIALLTVIDFRLKKSATKKSMQEQMVADGKAARAALGGTHTARAARIEEMFEQRNASFDSTYFNTWREWSSNENKYIDVHIKLVAERHLGAMDIREREHLRMAMLLDSAAEGSSSTYRFWITMLLWGDGKGEAKGYNFLFPDNDKIYIADAVQRLSKHLGGSVDNVVNAINTEVARLRGDASASSDLRAVAAELSDQLSAGGAGWLKSTKLKDTVFEAKGPHGLKIGTLADGVALSYSGDGSMITVAPPGSGKTQCNVFPNLLTWKGPAVVLDISGDIYENTSRWRAENVGPVYKFSPLEPEDSHCYNPLTFVRREADYIWEDARLLAEMMIVPSGASDPFWENEARNVLTAAIAHVCYSNPPDKRPMQDVLDVIYGGDAWTDMITGLKMAVDVRVMQQNATALASMNEKTLSSVLQTARSSLSAWTGERIARATKQSDWNPLDLRNGTNPTIYIYIRPNEVEAYLSLLRVFIGQHIRVLTGGAVPSRDAAPILFMLDELPRLRNMPPVDEALNIGRKYGLRLWMFAQSVGQLREAYKNADGMISSCAVRIYMNPSGADGLAEKLSEEIGNVDNLADGSRKRLVEAADLAGPAFKDQMIVFGLNARPAKVRKDFAYADPALKARFGALESGPVK